MATRYEALTAPQIELIHQSKLFFIASAHPGLEAGPEGQGPVNCSPKGNVPIHVIDSTTVAFLDYHGSGNETARHASAQGPVTVMFMSMDARDAAIVRLFGHAEIQPLETSPHAQRLLELSPSREGLRQIVVVHIESTQTSCGFGVPIFEYQGDRSSAGRGRRFK